MTQRQITLATMLTYSGTLPLVLAVILYHTPISGLDLALLARTYAAIILSFLCGIHWAVYLFFATQCPRNLLITSNAVALTSWVSLLVASPLAVAALQPLCFLYLLSLDLKLRDAGVLPPWFYALRRNATGIVVVCLCLVTLQS